LTTIKLLDYNFANGFAASLISSDLIVFLPA